MKNLKMERRWNRTCAEPHYSCGAKQTEQKNSLEMRLSFSGESKEVEVTV
jgi:hypothetical protein